MELAHPRFLTAGNAGPFTLDGTRTYLVGRRDVVVIDPGPELEEHVRALAAAVGDAESVTIVVTHGHVDHAPAAPLLAAAVGAEVLGPEGVEVAQRALADGDALETDEGPLVALDTPGHARHHLCLHWPQRRALFAGDLLLGRGDTTWVGEYPGCVQDYLDSLARLRVLDLRVVYPAHGPPLEDPQDALDRFEDHRRERIRQMEQTLTRHPGASAAELLDLIYGTELPDRAQRAATMSIVALKEHVERRTG